MTFALILGKLGGLLSKIAWWVWLLIAVFVWGFIGRVELKHERAAQKTAQAEQAKQIQILKDEKLAVEATWKARYETIKTDGDAKIASAVHTRNIALAELRKRPERRTDVPGVAPTTCSGSTGAELARPDAQFLERYAAVARGFQLALESCQRREQALEPK